MRNPWQAVAYNLKNLVRFKGRDDRATFWPYAASVAGLAMVAMTAGMMPLMDEMGEFAERHPDRARVEAGPGHYSIRVEGNPPELAGAFGDMMIIVGILFAGCIALLAAAVARRLHDTGKSGAWGLLPIPFIMFSCIMMARLFGQGDFAFGLFFAVFISNLFYLVSLAYLIVLLARRSDAAGNEYG